MVPPERRFAAPPNGVTFVRPGARVVVAAAPVGTAQRVVTRLRRAHYQSVLDGLGIEVWDRYDPTAVHFVCWVDDIPAACMRSTRDTVGSGEAAHDFPDLAARLPVPVSEFLYLSRQLVIPEFRGTGLVALITHATVRWWQTTSPLRYAVGSSRESTRDRHRDLGMTVLPDPAFLGPARTPIYLMGASLTTLAERTGFVLHRYGWTVEPAGEWVGPGDGAAGGSS